MTLTETLHGFIETTQDALLVFEGCRQGVLPRASRRPQEKERKMIQSGSIFVFDESESGIKRWTDGRMWSPSRILGNFLIYREVNKRLPGSGDSRRNSSISSASCVSQGGDMRQRSYSADLTSRAGSTVSSSAATTDRGRERHLVGSLSDMHAFRKNGLIKKTVSIVVDGVAQHLISYYHPRDVMYGELRNPTSMPRLASLEISSDLIRQNFRVAVSATGSYSGVDLAAPGSSLLSYPLTPSDLERCSDEQQQQQGHHNPFRSMSAGSLYSYGQSSTLSSSVYSNPAVVSPTDQKYPAIPLYPMQHPYPRPDAVGLDGLPFASASTPMLASSVCHPFTGSGNSNHGIMPSASYSPTTSMAHHSHGLLTQSRGGFSEPFPSAYHTAGVSHSHHSNQHQEQQQHLVSSFTATNGPEGYGNFHSTHHSTALDPSSGYNGDGTTTSLGGASLYDFASNAAGTELQHRQYKQAIAAPLPQSLPKSFFYSSTC